MDADDYRRRLTALAPAPAALTLAGAALDPLAELPRRIALARAHGVSRVRLEIEAARLAESGVAAALRGAASDEVCVVLDAAAAALPAADLGAPPVVRLLVDAASAPALADLVDAALRWRPARVELLADGGAPAPLSALEPALRTALARLAERAVETTVLGWPHCLPPAPATVAAPTAVIEEPAAPPRHCFYARACAWYGPCAGLAEPYIERFGWEIDRLRPQLRRAADAPPPRPAAPPAPADERRWLELLAGPDGTPMIETSLWALEGVTPGPRQVRYRFRLPNGGRYELVLEPRDHRRPRLAQTAGFNVLLVPIGDSPRPIVRRLLFTLLPIVSRNDDGRLRLG